MTSVQGVPRGGRASRREVAFIPAVAGAAASRVRAWRAVRRAGRQRGQEPASGNAALLGGHAGHWTPFPPPKLRTRCNQGQVPPHHHRPRGTPSRGLHRRGGRRGERGEPPRPDLRPGHHDPGICDQGPGQAPGRVPGAGQGLRPQGLPSRGGQALRPGREAVRHPLRPRGQPDVVQQGHVPEGGDQAPRPDWTTDDFLDALAASPGRTGRSGGGHLPPRPRVADPVLVQALRGERAQRGGD